MRIRFKQKGLESAEGRLAKLRQITTVSDLQGRFEAIANETDDISDRLMLRLFISGLREDIKNSVLSHEPKTFDEALKQAHIQERRIQAEKGPIRPALANKGAPLLPNPNVSSSYQNSSTIVTNNNLNRAAARPPLKRLSHAEIQSRREHGLCYYCEEKYTVGHKCKSPPQLLLLTNETDSEPILLESFVTDDILAEELQCLEVQEHSAISYHALAGGHSSSTL